MSTRIVYDTIYLFVVNISTMCDCILYNLRFTFYNYNWIMYMYKIYMYYVHVSQNISILYL